MFFISFIYKGTDYSAHMEINRPLLFAPLHAGFFFLYRLLGFIIKFFSNLWNILAFLCRIWLEGKIIIITESAKNYVAEIFRNLREHGYDPRMMRLTVMGGGGCLIKNFADCDKSRITIIDDIRATAKGYEQLATKQRERIGK